MKRFCCNDSAMIEWDLPLQAYTANHISTSKSTQWRKSMIISEDKTLTKPTSTHDKNPQIRKYDHTERGKAEGISCKIRSQSRTGTLIILEEQVFISEDAAIQERLDWGPSPTPHSAFPPVRNPGGSTGGSCSWVPATTCKTRTELPAPTFTQVQLWMPQTSGVGKSLSLKMTKHNYLLKDLARSISRKEKAYKCDSIQRKSRFTKRRL